MRQYLPRLWYDPNPLHVWSRSLSFLFFSALVCDLLPRRLFHGFAKGALPEEHLSHNFDEQCLEVTGLIWCLSYPLGGALCVLRFLLVREIDRGDWLARGCMPAHQSCDLFYLLVGDLLGSAINYVMLRSSGPGQVLGSWVANRMFAIRLVQWLSWVFETQERKKESSTLYSKGVLAIFCVDELPSKRDA